MAWDGNGSFTRTNGTQTGATTWANARDAGNNITASQHDTHDQDLADGIAACLTKNNETKPTASFRPSQDATHSLGSNALRWLNLYLSGFIGDGSGNELLKFSAAASAVNEVTVGNAATGNAPTLTATGGDTDIDIELAGKGSGAARLAGAVKLSTVLSPSQITSNQNDYAPTGHGSVSQLRLSSDASRDITGLAGGAAGRLLTMHNIGTQNIVLKDESASSTAANRFALNADITIGADQVVVLWYDTTSSRWRALASPSALSIASQAEAEAGSDNTKVMTPLRTSQAITALAAGFTSATPQDTTSGTAWTFSGIPSTATVILVMFSAFSTDGSSDILVQIGDSGGIENSGYVSSSASGAGLVTNTTGFVVADPVGASDSFNGMVILARLSSSTNTWVQIGGLHASAAGRYNESSGSKALSATLDRVSVTSVSTDTGDAGSVNILYR